MKDFLLSIYFSHGNPFDIIYKRLMCIATNTKRSKIMRYFSDRKLENIAELSLNIKNLPIYVCNCENEFSFDVNEIENMFSQNIENIGFIVIDYLQLCGNKINNTHNAIIKQVKNIANYFNVYK